MCIHTYIRRWVSLISSNPCVWIWRGRDEESGSVQELTFAEKM